MVYCCLEKNKILMQIIGKKNNNKIILLAVLIPLGHINVTARNDNPERDLCWYEFVNTLQTC